MNKFLSFIFTLSYMFLSAQNISEKVIKEYEDTLLVLSNNIHTVQTSNFKYNLTDPLERHKSSIQHVRRLKSPTPQ